MVALGISEELDDWCMGSGSAVGSWVLSSERPHVDDGVAIESGCDVLMKRRFVQLSMTARRVEDFPAPGVPISKMSLLSYCWSWSSAL